MLNYPPATERAVANLRNWVEGTVPLAWEEMAYLQRETDLLCANAPTDDALVQLEEMIECIFVRFHKRYRKVSVPQHLTWVIRLIDRQADSRVQRARVSTFLETSRCGSGLEGCLGEPLVD